MSNNIDFKLCCRCFTFNQSKYITETMNGFCIQETDFPFVCCIVDDSSTDGEQDVIFKYVEEHFNVSDTAIAYKKETDYAYIIFAPHKENKNCYFVVLLLKENHYSNSTLKGRKMSYLSEWREGCKFEAICEGDDYWIDPLKLQKQYDYMINNPDCGLVYTKSYILEQSSSKIIGSVGKPYRGHDNLLIENPIATLNVMMRMDIQEKYYTQIDPNLRATWKMGDYPLWLFAAESHNLHFMDEVTSVYRANVGSMSRPSDINKRLAFLNSMLDIQLYFAKRRGVAPDLIDKIKKANEERSILACLSMGEKKKTIELIKASHTSLYFRLKTLLRLVIK